MNVLLIWSHAKWLISNISVALMLKCKVFVLKSELQQDGGGTVSMRQYCTLEDKKKKKTQTKKLQNLQLDH